MPGSYLYPSERARYRYIANVLDVLVLRDVEEKHRVRNKVQLERACDFLMDNIGNISSVSGIVAALDAAGKPFQQHAHQLVAGFFQALG